MFENLIQKIDSDMAYVISPDHPNLMSPPDCLIAKNGKINAYYIIHSFEKKRLKNLLSRLALSRMALHVHTKHILVINSKDYNSKQSALSKHFDETIDDLQLINTLLLLNDETSSSSIEKAITGRDEHYIKYNVLYNQSLQQYKIDIDNERILDIHQNEFENVFYSDWLENNELHGQINQLYKSEYFHKIDKLVITIPDFKKSKRKIELLKKLCLTSLQIDSSYSDGILKMYDTYGKLIITDDFPVYQYDTLKSLRSAAFAGLSLTRAKNEESLQNYSNFLEHRIEENINEYKKKNRYNKRHYKR